MVILTRSEAIKRQNDLLTVNEDAIRYIKAQNVLSDLRKHYLSKRISPDVYKAAREKALDGRLDESRKILANGMERDK